MKKTVILLLLVWILGSFIFAKTSFSKISQINCNQETSSSEEIPIDFQFIEGTNNFVHRDVDLSFILKNLTNSDISPLTFQLDLGNGKTKIWNVPNMKASKRLILYTKAKYDNVGIYHLTLTVTYNNLQKYFDVDIHIIEPEKVTGIIKDIFSHDPLSNVKVTFTDVLDKKEKTVTTDKNGRYSIDIFSYSRYIPVTIRKKGYTPFHTWFDNSKAKPQPENENSGHWDYVKKGYKNFLLIPLSFNWKMYNTVMRGWCTIKLENLGNVYVPTHWMNPPDILIDTNATYSYLSTLRIEGEVVLYNVLNILPKFNSVDVIPSKVKMTNKYTESKACQCYVDWSKTYDRDAYAISLKGPAIYDASVMFNAYPGYHFPPDCALYNQELGSAMGATDEPTYLEINYESVFGGATHLQTYSEDDLKMGLVYCTRSKLHYLKGEPLGTNPEDFDWEARPDLIKKYYPDSYEKSFRADSNELRTIIHINFLDGSSKTWKFQTNQIPKDLVEKAPVKYLDYLVKLGGLQRKELDKVRRQLSDTSGRAFSKKLNSVIDVR